MIATEYKIQASPLSKLQWDSVILAIINGTSVNQWCKDNSVNQAHVYATIERDQDFERRYVRAREFQAETFADGIADIAKRALRGEVDPQAARVAIDALKWIVSKLLPKKYGDRSQLDIKVTKKLSMIDHITQDMLDGTHRRPRPSLPPPPAEAKDPGPLS